MVSMSTYHPIMPLLQDKKKGLNIGLLAKLIDTKKWL